MTETLPLYLYAAKPHHVTALKSVKQALGLDVKFQVVEAQPGQGGRTLAFGEHPGFVCESVLVESEAMVPDALRWAAGEDTFEVDGYEMKLSRWMGAEVKEIRNG